tara:strand:- start:957 stop:2249 length:1293 start_codon:yes stop_codon:yes gene_type:complete
MITPYELILKKQSGLNHTKEEIEYIVNSYLNGTFNDYHMTAWLMSVYFKSMNKSEILHYTKAIINSGRSLKWKDVNGFVVDKHSTGGVGDKVSIALAPILAACDCYVPMIVGRALGHTGGTFDKLESIPNYNAMLSLDDFQKNVKQIGCSIIGQIPEICPADLKIYNLRDQTATINSFPLICGSIMSKKIAEGINGLVLDIKVGNGAFMKNLSDAKKLAKLLYSVGKGFGLKMHIIFSNMNQILGNSAGLYCEVLESISILKGGGPKDLNMLVKSIAIKCLSMAGINNPLNKINNVIESGLAYEKFLQMIYNHESTVKESDISKINKPKYIYNIIADKDGYLIDMDAFKIGMNLIQIGAGRKSINDKVDYTAGILLNKKIGNKIQSGETIATIFNSLSLKNLEENSLHFKNSFILNEKKSLLHTNLILNK